MNSGIPFSVDTLKTCCERTVEILAGEEDDSRSKSDARPSVAGDLGQKLEQKSAIAGGCRSTTRPPRSGAD